VHVFVQRVPGTWKPKWSNPPAFGSKVFRVSTKFKRSSPAGVRRKSMPSWGNAISRPRTLQ